MNDRHKYSVPCETWHFLTGEFALYHQRRWRKCLIQVIEGVPETQSHVVVGTPLGNVNESCITRDGPCRWTIACEVGCRLPTIGIRSDSQGNRVPEKRDVDRQSESLRQPQKTDQPSNNRNWIFSSTQVISLVAIVER